MFEVPRFRSRFQNTFEKIGHLRFSDRMRKAIMRISNLVSEVLAGRWRWSSDETNLLPRVIWHQRNVASFRPALYKHWRAWWQQLGQAEEANLSKNCEFTSWGFGCATTCENCCVELLLWSTKALKSCFYSIFYGVVLVTSTALFVRLLRCASLFIMWLA